MINEIFENCPSIIGVMKIGDENFVHFHLEDGYLLQSPMLSPSINITGPKKHNNYNYVILASKDISIDELINVVVDINRFNKEKKEKEELFEATIKTLERIFNETSVDSLKNFVTTLSQKDSTDG